MELYEIILLCILGAVLVAKGYIVYKESKQNPEDVLEGILDQIISIATSTLAVMKEDRDNYGSEHEFRKAVTVIVAQEVRGLLENISTSTALLKVLSEEVIADFIMDAYDWYDSEDSIGFVKAEQEYQIRLCKTLAEEEQPVAELEPEAYDTVCITDELL